MTHKFARKLFDFRIEFRRSCLESRRRVRVGRVAIYWAQILSITRERSIHGFELLVISRYLIWRNRRSEGINGRRLIGIEKVRVKKAGLGYVGDCFFIGKRAWDVICQNNGAEIAAWLHAGLCGYGALGTGKRIDNVRPFLNSSYTS